MTPEDEKFERIAQAHIESLKKAGRKNIEDAAVRAVHKVMAEFEAKADERLMKDWGPGPHEYHSLPAQQEPEFFTHCVDQPYDWSEWVCPDPKGYLMKCCDCGLVHEAEFGVVRYKSETEREDCDMVDDPNLQAVFRMRRSEQWSPADTAHRAGGLTMEQPAQQEPVALLPEVDVCMRAEAHGIDPQTKGLYGFYVDCISSFPPAQQEPVAWPIDGDTARRIADKVCVSYETVQQVARELVAMQPAQPQQEPVYFCDYGYEGWGKVDADMAAANLADGMTVEAYYTSPPPQRKPLTDEQICDLWSWSMTAEAERTANTQQHAFARAIEAAHGIKENT